MVLFLLAELKGRAVSRDDAHLLLDRIGVLKPACDLDLLVFFARHPRALLTSEQLAAWLGYELKQIAESLEVLLEAGLLARTQNPTHAARMYVFSIGGSTIGATGNPLPEAGGFDRGDWCGRQSSATSCFRSRHRDQLCRRW
jgi:hypothetical protein